jgi:cellulose synthase/poly-beta-1,6-N-acetylglucosamine synthase-like glycosyltransferase
LLAPSGTIEPVVVDSTARATLEAAVANEATVLRAGVTSYRPLVSVVVSTRNHAAMLGRTVAAVMGQDLVAELEMIVVDDASTDATQAIMSEAVSLAPRQLTYVRLDENRGPAGGRNVGLELARGDFIAFTDSDCTPDAGWLRAALEAFSSPDVGVVQGRTEASSPSAPLFSHYIDTSGLDGSFSTSNVVYRRKAIGTLRFDPSCTYNGMGRPDSRFFWEDVDLGWRVVADGWKARFAPDALVRHEVIVLSPVQWMLWPRRYGLTVAKVARYPAFRRHLFLRVWVAPMHFWFDLAVAGAIGAFWNPLALLLILPYGIAFARNRGLKGRFPPAKVAAYLVWDVVALGSLVAASVRHGRLVL